MTHRAELIVIARLRERQRGDAGGEPEGSDHHLECAVSADHTAIVPRTPAKGQSGNRCFGFRSSQILQQPSNERLASSLAAWRIAGAGAGLRADLTC
jgi:hypothetical protein